MKVELLPAKAYDTKICDMKPGSLGVTETGYYYFATDISATCLNSYGMSYSDNKCEIDNVFVRILAPGERLVLTVGYAGDIRSAMEAAAVESGVGACTCGADRTGPSAEAHDDGCPAA
jgi:hypothetical protein